MTALDFELSRNITVGQYIPTGSWVHRLDPRIKLIDGRLFPFGFFRLLWNRKGIKRVRLISTNVLPEFQRWGLGLVVMSRLVPEVLKWGIQEAHAQQVSIEAETQFLPADCCDAPREEVSLVMFHSSWFRL